MLIRWLALVGFLGVVGAMVSAEGPASQLGGRDQSRVEDPFPPPAPRP